MSDAENAIEAAIRRAIAGGILEPADSSTVLVANPSEGAVRHDSLGAYLDELADRFGLVDLGREAFFHEVCNMLGRPADGDVEVILSPATRASGIRFTVWFSPGFCRNAARAAENCKAIA